MRLVGQRVRSIGGTVSGINDYSVLGGVVGILESTTQIKGTNLFVHAGVATEVLDDHWPISFTAGASRLARSRGDQVCDPWILSVTYDGYWDSSISVRTTRPTPIRFACSPDSPCDRVGTSAPGEPLRASRPRRDHRPCGAGHTRTFATARYFANRVAAYRRSISNDRGAQVISSAGMGRLAGRVLLGVDSFSRSQT